MSYDRIYLDVCGIAGGGGDYMNYEIERLAHDVVVVRLFGELDHHATEKIRTHVSTEILQGQLKLLIWNLGGLQFMDSSGIGLVLGRMRELETVEGKTMLLNPSSTTRKIFQFSGLGTYIVEGSEEIALQQVRGIVNG